MTAQLSDIQRAQVTARTVCHCCVVSDAEIAAAVHKGAREFETVQEITGACMGCGTCIGDVERAIRRAISHQRAGQGGQQLLPF